MHITYYCIVLCNIYIHDSLPLFSFCRAMLQKMIKLIGNFMTSSIGQKRIENTLFDIFTWQLGLIQELDQLIWYLVRNVFIENVS